MKKTENTQDIVYSGGLDAVSIDEMSEAVGQALGELNVSFKDTMRMRLSVESVMAVWAEEMGEATECRLLKKQRFGKTTLLLQADGKAVDPTKYQDDLLLSVSSNPNIAAALGLPAEYRYNGGRNELKLRLPEKKVSPLRTVLFAILSAVIVGLCLRWFLSDAATEAVTALLTSLINTVTNILRLIAGPLVFLSVISGITGVGDAASFGRMGGTLVKRFLFMSFILTALVWLSLCWMFPVVLSGSAGGENAFMKIFQMILDIVPGDVITPLQTGNAMQIIFVAVCAGIGSILLGDSVFDAVNVVNQINAIVQLLMKGITRILPVLIFLSIANLIITSDISELAQLLLPVLIITGICLAVPLIYGFYASKKAKIPVKQLYSDLLPSFIVAFSTASSSAAFSDCVECCEKKFCIEDKLVKFGIPFGQVMFKPGVVITFVVLSLYMAKTAGVAITPGWIIMMMIIVPILAVATPAIPGGPMSSVLVLFMQLGIPASCIALGTTVLIFSDYALSACNIVCLQEELLINAKKLNLMKKTAEVTDP